MLDWTSIGELAPLEIGDEAGEVGGADIRVPNRKRQLVEPTRAGRLAGTRITGRPTAWAQRFSAVCSAASLGRTRFTGSTVACIAFQIITLLPGVRDLNVQLREVSDLR